MSQSKRVVLKCDICEAEKVTDGRQYPPHWGCLQVNKPGATQLGKKPTGPYKLDLCPECLSKIMPEQFPMGM